MVAFLLSRWGIIVRISALHHLFPWHCLHCSLCPPEGNRLTFFPWNLWVQGDCLCKPRSLLFKSHFKKEPNTLGIVNTCDVYWYCLSSTHIRMGHSLGFEVLGKSFSVLDSNVFTLENAPVKHHQLSHVLSSVGSSISVLMTFEFLWKGALLCIMGYQGSSLSWKAPLNASNILLSSVTVTKMSPNSTRYPPVDKISLIPDWGLLSWWNWLLGCPPGEPWS